jgi:hypothetical protein
LNNTRNYLIGDDCQFTKGSPYLLLQFEWTGGIPLITVPFQVINDTHILFQVIYPDLKSHDYRQSILSYYYDSSSYYKSLSFAETWQTGSQKIEFLVPYSIILLENELKKSTAYTFKETKLTITFDNPPNIMTGVIVKIVNPSVFEYLIDSQKINVLGSKQLEVIVPEFSKFNVNNQFSFPFTAKLRVSFTDGIEFAESDLVINDKIEKILLFDVEPQIIHPENQALVILGNGFSNLTKCNFNTTNFFMQVNGYFEKSTFKCNISNIDIFKSTSLTVQLSNEYNDTSNTYTILILEKPKIFSQDLSSGKSIGNYMINLYGNFTKVPKITCKFDEFPCSDDCLFVNQYNIKCPVPSHPEGNSVLRISYNQDNWIASNISFNYVPCAIGETASNYSSACYPCPAGYYKPKSGLFDCFACPVGTYSNSTGSSSCNSCPINSNSKVEGLQSIYECSCEVGFFRDPKNPLRCVPCPAGAICDFNTTVPIPKKGRWFSPKIGFIYYECKPLEACGGFGAENCTVGYTGALCARCEKNYYKEKAFCISCGQIEIVWLQFSLALIIIIVILSICLVFLIFASIKISHLASLSIALSFWQIISIFR